jgi:hypothetical protein
MASAPTSSYENIESPGWVAADGPRQPPLRRPRARSGDPIAVAASLGRSDRFDRALAEFAAAYADLNEPDHRALARAIADGRVTAVENV